MGAVSAILSPEISGPGPKRGDEDWNLAACQNLFCNIYLHVPPFCVTTGILTGSKVPIFVSNFDPWLCSSGNVVSSDASSGTRDFLPPDSLVAINHKISQCITCSVNLLWHLISYIWGVKFSYRAPRILWNCWGMAQVSEKLIVTLSDYFNVDFFLFLNKSCRNYREAL